MRQILTAFSHLAKKDPQPDYSDWWKSINAWKNAEIRATAGDELLTPRWIMEHMSEATDKMPVVWITDVGQHQMWAAQHLQLKESRSWLTSGGMGTMGFGLPAAFGAQIACPQKRAVVISGDGGFKMTGFELFTISNTNTPVICVILDNHSLGMVRQLQYVFANNVILRLTCPHLILRALPRFAEFVHKKPKRRQNSRLRFHGLCPIKDLQ